MTAENWTKTAPTTPGLYWYRQKVRGRWQPKVQLSMRRGAWMSKSEIISNPEAEEWISEPIEIYADARAT